MMINVRFLHTFSFFTLFYTSANNRYYNLLVVVLEI